MWAVENPELPHKLDPLHESDDKDRNDRDDKTGKNEKRRFHGKDR